ncbi:hypothetical protein FACS1894199_09750 [Bacteroidia bacterium]|nr:hypothetical protein FACS1894199_09750 [Bacteroidia bacterium]
MKKISGILLSALFLFSCDDLNKFTGGGDDEIVAGLKEALKVGTNSATSVLGTADGYLKDEAVKILLPEEAKPMFSAIQTIAGNEVLKTAVKLVGINLTSDFEDVLITAFNRAAEDAAPQAVNIFVNAITDMTLTDGKAILFGENNRAATDYLIGHTLTSLTSAFSPVITASLDKVKVGTYTAAGAWEFFATQNNTLSDKLTEITGSTPVQIAIALGSVSDSQLAVLKSVKRINTNIGAYVTGKSLDGLFLKVGDQEDKIRTDVNARTSDLLKRVFGQLD